MDEATKLADELSNSGFDVLIDDRDDRPGPKFKDADLIGIPLRFIISPKTIEANQIEFKARSDDGKAALWVGAVDDAWKMGKPVGVGGPWENTKVKAGEPSDPYLMTAYDKKTLQLAISADATVTIEVDLTGDGNWSTYKTVELKVDDSFDHQFPDAFSAYWIRFTVDKDCEASALLTYK